MTEKEKTTRIKATLDNYSAQAPDFDALFGTEVLGDAALRRVVQRKLVDYVAEAPPFRQSALRLHHPPTRRLAWWPTAVAAAASLALLFFLPTPLNQPGDTLARMETLPVEQDMTVSTTTPVKAKPFVTQRLATPATIQYVDEPDAPAILHTTAGDDGTATDDSYGRETLEKLTPSHLSLTTGSSVSVEDAYARAREAKRHRAREKVLAGLNLNSGNRLLSFVNTNPGNNPLLAKGADYKKGLNVLEGAPMALRAARSSRNEWKAPANIPASTLSQYEATYSMPLTFGLSVSIPLNGWLEVQTGLNYTYLFSRTEGLLSSSTFTLDRELHYMGIPLRLGMTLYQYDNLRLYLAVGGILEKGLMGRQTSTLIDADHNTNDWSDRQRIHGVQPLSTALAGISYEFLPSFQLYLEPGATYAFNTDQPLSIRTEEPFTFSVGMGVRYRFK